jgi:hypothetical protein
LLRNQLTKAVLAHAENMLNFDMTDSVLEKATAIADARAAAYVVSTEEAASAAELPAAAAASAEPPTTELATVPVVATAESPTTVPAAEPGVAAEDNVSPTHISAAR